MKKDRDRVFLLHIRDAIEKIESYMEGKDFPEFAEQKMFYDAVVKDLPKLKRQIQKLI